jgi:hypothetical protein
MIAYFGWTHVVILTLMIVLTSFATGYLIEVFPGKPLEHAVSDKP